MSHRRTLVVSGPLAVRDARAEAARQGAHGLQILGMPSLAAKLAGGFSRPIAWDEAKRIVSEVLEEVPLHDLDGIRRMPGTARAIANTLQRAWDAGFAFSPAPDEALPRLKALAAIESAVLHRLPAGSMRPADLVEAALERVRHAPALLGSVTIRCHRDVSPVWRPLLKKLATIVDVTWDAAARTAPAWVADAGLEMRTLAASRAQVEVVSAATALHEAIEALRWARRLVASGNARPNEIAIVAAATSDYDDAFAALRQEANFPLRFAHGLPATSTREGQAASALADILVRGIRRPAVRRLSMLSNGKLSRRLPDGWARACPHGALAPDRNAWARNLADADMDASSRDSVLGLVDLLARGTAGASEAGEELLAGGARGLWRKALIEGPPDAVAMTLAALRIEDDDEHDGIVWAPASMLAAAPRRFVYLLGLSSRGWPRGASEDPIAPAHVLDPHRLDPAPLSECDRQDFTDILAHAELAVLSRPRRDAEGRLLGRSPLLTSYSAERYLRRNAPAAHAMSEADRLFGRPDELRGLAQAMQARRCWLNRLSDGFTEHDGAVRAGHPAIERILARTQSASSLTSLLRDAPGFVWRYALGMRDADADEEGLTLDELARGNLFHRVVEIATTLLTGHPQHGYGDGPAIAAAVATATKQAREEWESTQILPPRLVWERELARAQDLASATLARCAPPLPGQKTFVEVAFGGATPKSPSAPSPWRDRAIVIPGTTIAVCGYIDRLDLSGTGTVAVLHDYKTGKPIGEKAVINKGRELQRALYALAVQELLGAHVSIEARLDYVKSGTIRPLNDPAAVVGLLSKHLAAAVEMVRAGRIVPGPDSTGPYADYLLALPANAAAGYVVRKQSAFAAAAGAAAAVWDED